MWKAACVGLSLCAVLPLALAAEPDPDAMKYWGRWRGPQATGVAPYGDPPVEWSESKNIRWKVEIPGEGHSTPIIWGDRVYVQAAIKTDKQPAGSKEKTEETRQRPNWMGGGRPTHVHKFNILALDRGSGKVVWEHTAREELPHEGAHTRGSLASNSPVTDGEHLFAYFGSRGLYCLDMQGKQKWAKDFGDMRTRLSFGEGSSPVLYDDTIVVNWDHEDESFIVALDKNTGKQLWKVNRDESTSWATPIVVEHNGKPQVITSASKRVRGYDLATGNCLWECGGLTMNVIPSPVWADGVVYAMSGFRGKSLLAIRLGDAKGDITGSKAIVWKHNQGTPYVPSPLLYGDTLYFLDTNNAILSCLDAGGGKEHYSRQRLEGLKGVFASPVGAHDRVYVAGQNGATLVIKRSPKFQVLATNMLDDSFDASPAIVGREMYLRGHKYLYCIARD